MTPEGLETQDRRTENAHDTSSCVSGTHIPVMLESVLERLAPEGAGCFVDGTLGAAGYAQAILARAPACRVIGIDRDPSAIAHAKSLNHSRLTPIHGCFGDLDRIVTESGLCAGQGGGLADGLVDGVVLDIGVSSMQIDQPARGFSFRFDGPLDMRMDPAHGGLCAADILNTWPEKDIARILHVYGEERKSRRIAAAVVQARHIAPLRTTFDFAEIVRRIVYKSRTDTSDPATRSFQALRIAVNRELEELWCGLLAAERVLREGGRLVVVSFHSLEDSLVKAFFQRRAGLSPSGSRHRPPDSQQPVPSFVLPFRKPLSPSEAEMASNPRARSARLRAGIRTAAAPWPPEPLPDSFQGRDAS